MTFQELIDKLKNGEKFEEIINGEIERLHSYENVECINNEVYEDEDFYEVLRILNAEVDYFEEKDNNKFAIIKTNEDKSYRILVEDRPNRFGDNLPDETIFKFNIENIEELEIKDDNSKSIINELYDKDIIYKNVIDLLKNLQSNLMDKILSDKESSKKIIESLCYIIKNNYNLLSKYIKPNDLSLKMDNSNFINILIYGKELHNNLNNNSKNEISNSATALELINAPIIKHRIYTKEKILNEISNLLEINNDDLVILNDIIFKILEEYDNGE